LYRSGRGRVAFRPAFWRGGNHRTPSGLYRGRGRRGCLASLGGPPEWLGHLQFMPTPSEGDYGIFGWFWQSPVAGLIATLRGTCRPGLHEPRCARLTSILGLSGAVEHAGGASHVSFVDPRRSPFRALGLAMRRARERSALRPIRVHVGEARSQPTRCLVVFSQSCRSRPAAATVRGRGSLRLYPPTLRYSPDIHPSVAFFHETSSQDAACGPALWRGNAVEAIGAAAHFRLLYAAPLRRSARVGPHSC
jgi:hypothetical protein